MENASKALLIAGGILLTMLVVSLLVLMKGNLNKIANAEDDKKAAEQLTAFNASYEAYNKKLLNGTDIITIVNKAIENNLNVDDTHPWFVNVKIYTEETFVTTTLTRSADGTTTPGVDDWGSSWKTTGWHELKAGSNKMDDTMIKFFNNPVNTVTKNNSDGSVTYTYSALTNFQRAIFTCTGTTYSNTTGRITEITFTQKKV